MSKKIDCPHCSGEIELKPKEPKIVEVDLNPPEPPKAPEVPHSHPEIPQPPENPHEKLADMLPSGVNFGKCENGQCVELVKNKKLVTQFKTCQECGFNGVPETNSFCPVCGHDGKEWDDSDINIEKDDE